MVTAENTPAEQSYIQQHDFHRGTYSSALRSALAAALPRSLRQRLRLRRRLDWYASLHSMAWI
jgi:hypothetical protein